MIIIILMVIHITQITVASRLPPTPSRQMLSKSRSVKVVSLNTLVADKRGKN